MSIWGWLKLTIAVWLFRKLLTLAGWLIIAAAAVAAWPVTVVAAAGYGAAWLRGWPPARLWNAAAWSLPMTAVYFTGFALRLRSWPAVALAPVNDWAGAWRLLAAHAILRAGPAVPVGPAPPRPRRAAAADDRDRHRQRRLLHRHPSRWGPSTAVPATAPSTTRLTGGPTRSGPGSGARSASGGCAA